MELKNEWRHIQEAKEYNTQIKKEISLLKRELTENFLSYENEKLKKPTNGFELVCNNFDYNMIYRKLKRKLKEYQDLRSEENKEILHTNIKNNRRNGGGTSPVILIKNKEKNKFRSIRDASEFLKVGEQWLSLVARKVITNVTGYDIIYYSKVVKTVQTLKVYENSNYLGLKSIDECLELVDNSINTLSKIAKRRLPLNPIQFVIPGYKYRADVNLSVTRVKSTKKDKVKIFDNIYKASKFYELSVQTITNNIEKKTMSKLGYKFEFMEVEGC